MEYDQNFLDLILENCTNPEEEIFETLLFSLHGKKFRLTNEEEQTIIEIANRVK